MMWSKLSSSSFFRVAHILIISGRVPKIDITFMCLLPYWPCEPSRRGSTVAGRRGENRNFRQRQDHAPALGEIVSVLLADLIEKTPGKDQQVIRRVGALQDRAWKNLEMRFRRVEPGLCRRIVDHVVEMIVADSAILNH